MPLSTERGPGGCVYATRRRLRRRRLAGIHARDGLLKAEAGAIAQLGPPPGSCRSNLRPYCHGRSYLRLCSPLTCRQRHISSTEPSRAHTRYTSRRNHVWPHPKASHAPQRRLRPAHRPVSELLCPIRCQPWPTLNCPSLPFCPFIYFSFPIHSS